MMAQLRVLGIRFSIDDFGTGYSSLAHLKRLPVDEVKIDRSFIKELEAQRDDEVIVSSTINLGHALHLKVVAEGVEEASSWTLLGRLGCDLIQGYFVAKPMPVQGVHRLDQGANRLARLPRSRRRGRSTSRSARCFHRLNQLAHGGLRIAVEHAGLIEHEQRVVDAGETLALAALDDDDVLRLVGIQDRHAVDGARAVWRGHRD